MDLILRPKDTGFCIFKVTLLFAKLLIFIELKDSTYLVALKIKKTL